MQFNQQQGILGENLATEFLVKKGYKIVGRNVRVGRSEFDIIASVGETLIFIEVKTRKNSFFGHPETFVGHAKENAMIRGAEKYVDIHNHRGEIRFDIISVVLEPEVEIVHFEDAFWNRL